MLGLTISYMYTRNCTAASPEGIGRPIVTKRDNSGTVKTPEMKLIPPGVPVSSSDNAGYLHWRKVFAKFLHTNRMAAWHIWMTEDSIANLPRICALFGWARLQKQTCRIYEGILWSSKIWICPATQRWVNCKFKPYTCLKFSRYYAKEIGKGCVHITPCDGKNWGNGH